MAHPLETRLRDAYAAFGRGDLEGYWRACTADFKFHVPGRSGVAGTYLGKEGLQELARKVMGLSGGSFQEEVEDVLANDRHAVVLARHRLVRGGMPREYRTAHVYEIAAGKLAECFEQPRDPAGFDEAWGLSQVAAAQGESKAVE
jgi:ketosteroid isomerase-like protein